MCWLGGQLHAAGLTFQKVCQRLGAKGHGPLGLVVGDGVLLHAQLLRHLGLSSVVHQRASQQLAKRNRDTIRYHFTFGISLAPSVGTSQPRTSSLTRTPGEVIMDTLNH